MLFRIRSLVAGMLVNSCSSVFLSFVFLCVGGGGVCARACVCYNELKFDMLESFKAGVVLEEDGWNECWT